MAIAFVQEAVRTRTGVPAAAIFLVPATAGNSLIAVVSYLSSDTGPILTGNGGGAVFSLAVSETVSGVTVEIWVAHSIGSGVAGVNFDTDNEDRLNVNASEWSGLANAGAEATNSQSGLLDNSPVTGNVTPSSDAALIIAGGAWTADDYSSGPTNSFTRLTQIGGGAAWQEAAYQIESSVAAYSTGWGLTAGVNWAAVVAAFGEAVSGASGSQNLPLMGVG